MRGALIFIIGNLAIDFEIIKSVLFGEILTAEQDTKKRYLNDLQGHFIFTLQSLDKCRVHHI